MTSARLSTRSMPETVWVYLVASLGELSSTTGKDHITLVSDTKFNVL